jgi:hypothetical protein
MEIALLGVWASFRAELSPPTQGDDSGEAGGGDRRICVSGVSLFTLENLERRGGVPGRGHLFLFFCINRSPRETLLRML